LNRCIFVLVASGVLLFVLALVSLVVGPIPIRLTSVVQWLIGGDGVSLTSTEQAILWELRLPRIVTACFVGGSLGISGVGFQALFRNPLADPYVIGASSGAALGVTLALVTGFQLSFMGLGGTALAALLGSILAVIVVFAIGSVGRDGSSLSLLLAGVALSSMINALVSLMMYLHEEKVVVILAWLMGSLADNDWNVVLATAIASFAGFSILFSLSRALDAFSLGDVASQSLGLDLVRFRILMVTGSSLATAAAVAAAGIIGFIGLIAPHIARALVGPRHRFLIPMSAIVGATLLLIADGLARTIVAPAELPVGIVTAILGCPFFLFLLKTRAKVGGLAS
tara:strand:- start:3072 stop:4091 length:1020 start_codon:yes stop_codon:yes gene_type:complete